MLAPPRGNRERSLKQPDGSFGGGRTDKLSDMPVEALGVANPRRIKRLDKFAEQGLQFAQAQDLAVLRHDHPLAGSRAARLPRSPWRFGDHGPEVTVTQ
jgi:hypothetical protein